MTLRNKSSEKDTLKKRRRNKWTIILFLLYVILSSIDILFGHKINSKLEMFVLFPVLILPFCISMLWTKMNTKTKWQDFLSTLKMILFAAPFVWLILGSKEIYRNFHLKNYRRLTPGLVVNTFNQPNNRGGTTSYYAIVVYKIDNIQMQKACYMHPSEYHKGDSVFIAYSFKDPDFYELAGRKTTK